MIPATRSLRWRALAGAAMVAAVAVGPLGTAASAPAAVAGASATAADQPLDLSRLHWAVVQVRVRARVDGRTVQYRIGTGVYLGAGRVLTAKHLFEEYLDAEVVFGGRERVVPVVRPWKPADGAAFFDQTDVVMLTGVNAPGWVPAVAVATRPPSVGDRVTSVGLAEPGLLRVRSGPVTALRAFDGTFESVMPSQQGDSGGPTFNARGELVGVHCANITRGDGTGRGVQTSLSYDATRLALGR